MAEGILYKYSNYSEPQNAWFLWTEINCKKLEAKQNFRTLSVPKSDDSGVSSAAIITQTVGGFLLKHWDFTPGVYPDTLKYPKRRNIFFLLEIPERNLSFLAFFTFPSDGYFTVFPQRSHPASVLQSLLHSDKPCTGI